jgi:sulfate adenylyltransferase subunit 1
MLPALNLGAFCRIFDFYMSNDTNTHSTSGYLDMDLLRFTTAGSVDDGKSTLIGRLLYDSKNIFEDQMEAMEVSSRQRGDEHVNLALLTDGLKAEREQGITIDVAYRYFATPKRKFIIADTPGHIQYTRNMVTGASTANLAIILIDARKGVIEQTSRHAFIANLLRIQHVIIAVNKMDLVDYSQEVYEGIVEQFKEFASRLDNIVEITFIPISALKGDNVVDKSEKMTWYGGPTLLYHLETVYIGADYNHVEARFPVQWVIRPHSDKYHDFRGYAGRVAGGVFKPGDEIMVQPSGFTTKIKAIHTADGDLEEAFAPLSCAITLEDEIDISRGDMIVKRNNPPEKGQDIEAMVCWFSEKKMVTGGKYILRHTSKEVKAMVKQLKYKVNINTLHKVEDDNEFGLNEIGRMELRTSAPLFYDSYKKNRVTGSFVLIDEQTNETVAAGMLI